MSIAQNSTIRDRIGSINKPEDFLIRVMSAMRKIGADKNGAVVRLGIGGKGTHPNFKVGREDAPQSEHVAFDYNGPEFGTMLQTHTWSSRGMTYAAIAELLSDLRAKRIKL